MISVEVYRLRIGLFNCNRGGSRSLCSQVFFFSHIFPRYLFYFFTEQMLCKSGDVETNPGPPRTNIVNRKGNLKIGHVNIRSILSLCDRPAGLTKHDMLCAFLSVHKFNIMGVTESWLDPSIPTEDLLVPGYLPPIRRDRNRHGGGVMVFISDSTPAIHRPDLEHPDCETICIEVQTPVPCLVCICYKPPTCNVDNLLSGIEKITDGGHDCPNVVFLGDFNSKHSNWYENDTTCPSGRSLKLFFDSRGYTQVISEPTRFGNESTSCSCIDLIFSNSPFLINDSGTMCRWEHCDHCPIYCNINTQVAIRNTYTRHVWDYKRGDYELFRNLLRRAPWDSAFAKPTIDDTVEEFMYIFRSIADVCVPNYDCLIRPHEKEWMNSGIRTAMRHRDRLHAKRKSSPNLQTEREYKQARNNVTTLIRRSKLEHDIKTFELLSNPKTELKQWWRYLKQLGASSTSSKYSAPLRKQNKLITDPQTKARLFNEFFASQTSVDPALVRDLEPPPAAISTISDPVFTEFEVFKLLIGLNTNKATGPDGIGNKLLKEAAPSLCAPLCRLFNKCITAHTFPTEWKISNVIPLHKKDDISEVNNYRPVSLLCCISKVFERLMYTHIYTFLTENNIITYKQSGFRPGDSTINQLIYLCHKISTFMNSGDEVRAVFLDFSKAFDKVWHLGLLWKLEMYGVTGNTLKWLQSYLAGRKQRVTLGAASSELLHVQAGVPQGSVLGPLLFLVYINDLVRDIETDIFMFADDASVFENVKGNSNHCASKLNRDLRRIEDWCGRWLLLLNEKKTVSLLFSRKRNPSPELPLLIKNSPVQCVNRHRHLGMLLTKTLDWSDHISNIHAKAMSRLHAISRHKHRLDRRSLENYIRAFVISLLDYGDVLYDNCKVSDRTKLEEIQLFAARIVLGAKRGTSHEGLYKLTGWQPLYHRRNDHKCIKFFEIVKHLTPSYLHSILPEPLNARNTRGSYCMNYRLPASKSDHYKNSFIPSCTDSWNNLPMTCKSLNTKSSFKASLKRDGLRRATPQYSYTIDRKTDIILNQMRLGFSDLNHHLFSKGCIPHPTCSCGYHSEDLGHYFFQCHLFENQRHSLLQNLSKILPPDTPVTVETLLGITDHFETQLNTEIIQAVASFIKNSGRF